MNENIYHDLFIKFSRNIGIYLDDENIALIKSIFKTRLLKKDTFFLQGGEKSSKIGFIINGTFRSYYIDKNGNDIKNFLTNILVWKSVFVIEPGAVKTNFFKTLANNSNDIISNPNSYYSNFYKHDIQYRGKQISADPKKAAEDIAHIISKKHLRSRYKIVVPFMYSMLTHFPDSIKKYFFKRALD